MHWTVPVQTVFQSTLRITLPWRFGSCEQTLSTQTAFTGVEVFIGSKVQCLFCFETSTTEGRGGAMGGSANFKYKAHRTFDPRNNTTPVHKEVPITFKSC